MGIEKNNIAPFKDVLGRDLYAGDYVVFPSHTGNSLGIAQILKQNKKMMTLQPMKGKTINKIYKYSNDLCKIDSKLVTVYLLKFR